MCTRTNFSRWKSAFGTTQADQGLSAADDGVRCIWCQDLRVLVRRAPETVQQNNKRKSKMADSAAFVYAWLLSVLRTLQTLYVMFNTEVFSSVDSSGVPHLPARFDNLGPLTLMSPWNRVHLSLLLCTLSWSRSNFFLFTLSSKADSMWVYTGNLASVKRPLVTNQGATDMVLQLKLVKSSPTEPTDSTQACRCMCE